MGNKWSEIAMTMPGRTRTTVQARWQRTLKLELSRRQVKASHTQEPVAGSAEAAAANAGLLLLGKTARKVQAGALEAQQTAPVCSERGRELSASSIQP